MKSLIITLTILATLSFSACQSPADKAAKAEVRAEDSTAARQANAQYLTFKEDADREINANNDKIAHLRDRLAKSQGQAPLDPARERKIDDLEKRNADLRATIAEYKYQASDWDAFKTKWNQKRDDARHAFNDADADMNK